MCKKYKESLPLNDVRISDTDNIINSFYPLGRAYYIKVDEYLRYSLMNDIIKFNGE